MITEGIAEWAFVNNLEQKYRVFKITLTISKAEADKLKAAGLKVVKTVDEDDNVKLQYKFTRNEFNKKTGAKNPKPGCVDAALQPFEGIIGNGSKVLVKHKPFEWTYKGKPGMSSDLQSVQILKLVPYEGKEQEDEDPTEGFEVRGEGLKQEEGSGEEDFKKEDSTDSEY